MSRNLATYQRDVERFVDPNASLAAEEQLKLMADFNGEFGRKLPSLTTTQQDRIKAELESREGFRVVPTLLPEHTWQRPEYLTPAENSPLDEVIGHAEPGILHTYEEARSVTGDWYKLWAEPGGRFYMGDDWLFQHYAKGGDGKLAAADTGYVDLRYKAPDGKPVSRQRYIGALVASGQALPSNNGAWTMPVMDVSDTMNRNTTPVEAMWADVSPVASPEARINTLLLHWVAGKPKNEDVIEHVNEAVYRVDKRGRSLQLLGLVGITWSSSLLGNRIRQAFWTTKDPESEIPKAVSGL